MTMIIRSDNLLSDPNKTTCTTGSNSTIHTQTKQTRPRRLLRRWHKKVLLFWVQSLIVFALSTPGSRYGAVVWVSASDDYYYSTGDDAAATNDDANSAADAATNDDGAQNDENSANADQEEVSYNNDDKFHFQSNGFGSVSVMPTSCINYNNGHMIKFDFFDNGSSNGHQCRFNHIGSFVVSIAHYMRAYFNDRALAVGEDFALPGDAGYLNCVMLQETAYAQKKLYAKIGCMDRETFTSTKLQLHVYTDSQCSVKYDDGETSKKHSSRGYEINGYYFATRVSFRPPFYTCDSCIQDSVSETFNKQNGNWYDDDYIAEHGKKESSNYNNNNNNGDVAENDEDHDDYYGDDYFGDDTYMYANDDVGRGNRDRNLKQLTAAPGQLEAFAQDFWTHVDQQRRSLYDNYYDVGDWNICQRIYKYGVWCDEECQSLDSFRVDEWSKADVFLLLTMCVFMAAMMLLVVAKRIKASQKAGIYGDDNYKPGLPPLAMALIFFVIIGIIVAMAHFKFVNETLVFAVVTCILLFIYMLKLTLFESRRPVLLAAPRHDMFDNPLDDRLFT